MAGLRRSGSTRSLPFAVAAALVIAPPASAAPGDPARRGGTTVQVVRDLPAFEVRIAKLTSAERRAMTPSVWRRGCPVGLGSLRAIDATHIGFDGRAHRGTVVVHASRARGVAAVLRELYEARYPIRRMHPIERYGGSDSRSIDADNASAFNCRKVTGGSGWSEHAYGRAVDINPIENPYVTRDSAGAGRKASEPFLDRRTVRPGMATAGSIVVTAFEARGWRWGGRWTDPIDLQHFSTTGR